MPPRIGAKGAIVKPRSSTNNQRHAGHTLSKVIDLTRNFSNESPGKTPGGCSAVEEEAEDAPECHRERRISHPGWNDRQRVARHGPEDVLEDSYVVTSLHHRPWALGVGDDTTTVGVFFSEEEAKFAAQMDFQRIEERADGWESEWYQLAGDGMMQLRGIIEEGEGDSERNTASIKLVQQKRPVAVQPSVQSGAQPETQLVKPRYVYIVKEEQRTNVRENDTQGLHDDCGDLKAVHMHGVHSDLDAANEFVREIYVTILDNLGWRAETVTDTTENNIATIVVENSEDSLTYTITVEEKVLY